MPAAKNDGPPRVSVPGSGHAFATTMLSYDLDNPLALDFCDLCGLSWPCLCDASRPNRRPTVAELERARQARLTRAELENGAA